MNSRVTSGDALSDGLTIENFTQIGARGVIDPRNSYSQAMAWFKDKLYVGMTRDTLCLLKRPGRKLRPPEMEFWPVKCPENTRFSPLWRGQILSYDFSRRTWEKVYEAPMITVDGERAMRDAGYRGMAVHQEPDDSNRCLYVGTMSIPSALILRSEDGVNFVKTPAKLGASTSIRSLISYRGKLYASTVGKPGHHPNESLDPVVFESEDPPAGRWRAASNLGFGDPGNKGVFELAQFNGFLYAATMNPIGGFQLWKTDAEGEPPYRWKKVITAGAYRGFLNEYGMSLVEHGGCLYVGTGISGGGYDQVYRIGPAASELLRVYRDDTWDLVVGAPRITPQGTKIPLSGMWAGFNNFLNGYVWRMCVHEGWLYIGTLNSAVFLSYKPYETNALGNLKFTDLERLLPTGNIEKFIADYGGCHLWRTKDGEQFYPITRNGFDSPYNMGIRQMVSTPVGLFVGTANPFGPLVGIKRKGKWDYEPNPRGGAEIWLGSSQVKEKVAVIPGNRSRDQQYRHALLKFGRQFEQGLYSSSTEHYYEKTGFHHIGYWRGDCASAKKACEALLETLMLLIPDKGGNILDVACGKGGTTQYLLKYFRPSDLIGIDESQWAVDYCQQKVPNVRFLTMNPARLEFTDESFANIICVEGAPYFDTRKDFLKEALRVLRPGGRLVLSDILFSKSAVIASRGRYRSNYVKDLNSYRNLLLQVGFEPNTIIVDLTEDCIKAYVENISEYMKEKYRLNEIGEGRLNAVMSFVSRFVLFAKQYILVRATRK